MNRYETILKSIGDAVIVTDGSGAIELMNPAAEALTGWSDKEAKGKPVEKIFRIINEETKVGLESPVARVLREGTVIGLANHTLLIARDGKVYAIADSGAPIYDEPGGKITGVVLVFRDQTRERAAQRALDEAHKFAENIIATVREPLLVLDGDLKIITANKAFYRTFKVKKKATEGKLIYDLGNRQWDIPQLRELLEDILPKNTSFENYKVEHDFETIGRRTMLLNARRIKTEAGKDQFILLAIEDISERFRLEEQYRQAQKLEAVALLAGGVAHDFNNLLTVILGYGETIIRALHKDDPLRKDIGEILSAGEQGSSLTQQLLAFSRKQTLQPKILNLNKIVGNLQKLLRRLLGEDIDLVTVLADDLGTVKADAGQIEQVLMNLVVNARDAMPKGGKLTIETANVELDQAYQKGHIGVHPGQYVMLAVTDTGFGMDEQTQKKIFEPFFTTKEKARGTGLGLSTVYGTIKQSGGHIWVYSEPGKGTTFKVYLQRAEEKSAPEAENPVEAEVQPGVEHILVVEDAPAVRKLVKRMLESMGYEVTLAANGGEALLAVEEKGVRPDLLMTDVVMPGMSGAVLLERLRKTQPDLKVLFMSGYTDNAIIHHGVLDSETPFIQKPFSMQALSAAIRKLL